VVDFPVRKTIGAHHFLVDLTLPYGQYDYNKRAQVISNAA
jgi:acetoacetate decarboxylase